MFEVFRCPFRDTPLAVKACTQEYAASTGARQHLNMAHKKRTVGVEILEKTKTTQCPHCGNFLQKHSVEGFSCDLCI